MPGPARAKAAQRAIVDHRRDHLPRGPTMSTAQPFVVAPIDILPRRIETATFALG
jgi:hypothetical protein